jgi:hypothetical protein
VLWSVRPDQITITPAGQYPATVTDAADLGTSAVIDVTLTGGPGLLVRAADVAGLAPGDDCRLDIPASAIALWRSGTTSEHPGAHAPSTPLRSVMVVYSYCG